MLKLRTGALPFLAVVALATAACGPAATGPQGSPGPIDEVGQVGDEATPTPETQTTEPEPEAPTYPDSAAAYAKATMAALADNDAAWLGELTTNETYDQLVELPGEIDDAWTFHRCDGAAGSSYCSFINVDGDVLALRISNALVGAAHAATEVTYDATEYPNDSVEYVKEFIGAWQFGNTVRMLLMSTPAVVNKLPSAPTTTVTYTPPTCCGGGLVQVKAKWSSSTKRFDLGSMMLGGPHAIIDYAVEFGFTS